MIPKFDREPEQGREGHRKLVVVRSTASALPEGSEITAEVTFDDGSPVDGTPVNRATEIEYLAASGVTTGTASVLNLAQEGFALADGAVARVKFHTNTTAPFTLNVEFTGAIPVYDAQGGNTANYNANTWGTFVYSQTLNRWIAQGAGAQIIDNLSSNLNDAALSARQGRILNEKIPSATTVIDHLNSTSGADALSANQGRILNDKIGTPVTVVDNLTSMSPISALSANMGRTLRTANSLGLGAKDTTPGDTTVAIGTNALKNLTGYSTGLAIGYNALQGVTSGTANLAIGAYSAYDGNGSENIAIGNQALSNASGERNVAVGGGAIAQGGSRNTAIGDHAMGDAPGIDDSICIGSDSTASASHQITLGDNGITQLRCQVQTISALSDARIKEDIQPANIEKCLDAVKALPVTRYKYKDFTGTHLDKHVTGWMAEDVEKVFPKAVTETDEWYPGLDENGERIYETDENGEQREKRFKMEKVKSITMTEALPTLWGAMQALIERVEYLEKKLAETRY